MSVELEVRSDDEYSQQVPRGKVEALLRQWSAEPKSEGLFVHSADGCYIEVTLGSPEAAGPSHNAVAWVGFRVPAGARFKSLQRMREIGSFFAANLGWRVFDPQVDDYVDSSDLEPGPSLRAAVGRLVTETEAVGCRQLVRLAMRRLGRQSAIGILLPVVLGFGAASAVGWLFRFSFETRAGLFGGLVLLVAAGVVLLDIVSDVLGEVHQGAIRKSKATSGGSHRTG